MIVVYKVDRLTRSLADFARIVETFDGQGAGFVSITQQFNTTSSMGRLTLNVLLSFAQFEREVTGERIRDKIAASKRKGMRRGGTLPLGYEVGNRELVVNEVEATTVRGIFEANLRAGTLSEVRRDLRQRGILSKRWTSSTGRTWGGSRGEVFTVEALRKHIERVAVSNDRIEIIAIGDTVVTLMRRGLSTSRRPIDHCADIHHRIVVTGEKGSGGFQPETAVSLETPPTATVSGVTPGRRIAGERGVWGEPPAAGVRGSGRLVVGPGEYEPVSVEFPWYQGK